MSKNLLHFTHCWHEEFAKVYKLKLVDTAEEADILIVRDPLDRRFYDVIEYLNKNGNTDGLTFEEYLFAEKNLIAKRLGIIRKSDTVDRLRKFKFLSLAQHVRWPSNFIAMHPKTQTEPNPYFSIHKTNDQLAKYLNVKTKMFELPQQLFQSNDVDTALRADFQMHNDLDYHIIQKLRELGEFGEFDAG
jgi:hypothetical protein